MKLLFRVWPGESRPRLMSPLPAVRAAIASLSPVFRYSGSVRYIDPEAPDAAAQLAEMRPAILAGSMAALAGLAPSLGSNGPTHAVLVLTDEGKECISDGDRDDLWRLYGVPAFEQVITADGRLLAWECEAHDGLHLTESAQPPARVEIVTGTCDCKAAAPRAMGMTVAPRAVERKAAASLWTAVRVRSSQRTAEM